jgi:hypothetical protein
MLVLAVAKPVLPRPRKLTPTDVRRSIQRAKNVCYGAEDAPACRVAWDHVDELSHALARQQERELVKKTLDEMRLEDELEKREYDV